MARAEDLTVTQGTDASFKIFIVNSDGTAKDLTSKDFSASMKKTYADATTINFNVNVVDANNGILTLSLTDDQTVLLDYSRRYVYDVMMFDAGANTSIENILRGKVFVQPSVTRIG